MGKTKRGVERKRVFADFCPMEGRNAEEEKGARRKRKGPRGISQGEKKKKVDCPATKET